MYQSTAPYPPDSPEARVSDATTYFGLDLMRAISFKADTGKTAKTTAPTILDQQQPQQDRTVVSPLSMQTLLNVILLGAADNSLSQARLARVLGYGDGTKWRDKEDNTESTSARLAWAHEAMHNVVASIIRASRLPSTQEVEAGTSRPSFTLKNLVLFNKDILDVDQGYLSTIERYYSEILCTKQYSRHVPLTSDRLGEQLKLHQFVNLWVEEVTNGQMKGSADESSLSKKVMRLALVSATHLKAHWLHAFDPSLTQEGIFYNNGRYSPHIKVKFMRQTGLFGYVDMMLGRTPYSKPNDPPYKSRVNVVGRLCCQVLSLPLSTGDGQELSMVILVPEGDFTVGHLIEDLTVRGLNQIYRFLHEHWVEVQLPKFTIEASHDAGLILSKLGLSHLFGYDPELDPIQVPEEEETGVHVRVDKIIQMARVDVDEQGVEVGGASTAPVAQEVNVDSKDEIPKAELIVDRPFLFIIRHNRSNMPLFIGQVTEFPESPIASEPVAPPSDSQITVDYEPKTPEARLSQAATQLGIDLLGAISSMTSTYFKIGTTDLVRKQLHQENTVVSPLSLQILLNIVLLGAKDKSLIQAELVKVLGYGDETKSRDEKAHTESTSARLAWVHDAMHDVVASIMEASCLPSTLQPEPDVSQFRLTLENLMLINDDLFSVNQEYLSALKRYYSEVLFVRRFSLQVPQTSSITGGQQFNLHEHVNMWIREVTNNQITGLTDDEPSPSKESLALAFVSVTRFEARWLHAFDPSQTQDRTFYNRGHFENCVTTKFMGQTGLFGFVCLMHGRVLDESDFFSPRNLYCRRKNVLKRLNCQVLSLPFSAGDGHEELSMVILLPYSPGLLDELFEELTAQGLDMLYRTLTERLVSVQLPKFNIEVTHDVEPILSKLGVSRIFGTEAELDSMQAPEEDHKPHVKVDKIIQKTKIEVDEHGVGAAAASTASASQAASIDLDEGAPEVHFVADRPFLYIIRHNRSGMPLFMGQVTNFPQA